MKFPRLALTLAAGAAFALTGAGVAQAAPWQFVGSFPTKEACEAKAQEMRKAGKIDDHSCSPNREGYGLGVHYR